MLSILLVSTLAVPATAPTHALLGSSHAISLAQISSSSPRSGDGTVGFLWADHDGDGVLDACVLTPAGGLRLLRGLGDGSFEDVTKSAGLDGVKRATIALWQDFDGDGWLDLFAGTLGGPVHLFQNLGGGAFADIAPESGLGHAGVNLSADALDYDKDGRADLHVHTSAGEVLYRNLGKGHFESVELPLEGAGPSGSILTVDNGPTGVETPMVDGLESGPISIDESGIVLRGRGSASSRGSGVESARAEDGRSGIPLCRPGIHDEDGGPLDCLPASHIAREGYLYPLSDKLFVEEATGEVGIGTLAPSQRLEVVGGMTVDAATLFVNSTNNRVGIGTDAPGQALEVVGGLKVDSSTLFVDSTNNFVGIGTLAPTRRLSLETTDQVCGLTMNALGASHGESILTFRTFSDFTGWDIFMDDFTGNESGGDPDLLQFAHDSPGPVLALDGSTERVGIRTPAPSHSLTIEAPDDDALRLIGPGALFGEGARMNFGDGDFVYLYENVDDSLEIHAENEIAITGDKLRIGTGSNFEQDIDFRSSTGDWQVGTNGTGNGTSGNHFYIFDSAAATHRLTVQRGTGNVGIGTPSPTEKLYVVGNICATGTIGACSDERFKANVAEIEDALAIVRSLRGVRYDWKRAEFPEREFSSERQVGFIAQEVAEALPEVVSQGSDGTYSVDYGKLTPVLAEAVQELAEDNDELRQANEALSARVARLEAVEAEIEALKAAVAALTR